MELNQFRKLSMLFMPVFIDSLDKSHGDYQTTCSNRFNDVLIDRNDKISLELLGDRLRTQVLLRKVGLPVPLNQPVYFSADLETAIEKVGSYPIAIKPLDAPTQSGTTFNINNLSEAQAASKLALQVSKSGGVLVEKYYCGNEYRILVINGRVLRVIEILPAESTGHDASRSNLKGANEPIGLNVFNFNKNKIIRDFTSKIHFRNLYLAQTIAAIVGLDAIEVEIVCQDLSIPLHNTKEAIINVNSSFRLKNYFV